MVQMHTFRREDSKQVILFLMETLSETGNPFLKNMDI